MANRWQAVKMPPLDVGPQKKCSCIELPELPPEAPEQLWLTVRVMQPNATAWSSRTHQRAAAMASGGKTST
ncbi:hypothetical protein [Escherichia coli]|uniref:hypothetical protein n=1 Tax=Escherichia coli TaxID=562 RepID=UPI00388D9456